MGNILTNAEILKIKIVIVNYKRHQDTIECLETVFKLTYADYQVFIVDNSPTDISFQAIKDWADSTEQQNIPSLFPELVEPTKRVKIPYVAISEDELKDAEDFHQPLVLIKSLHNEGFAAANNIALEHINKVGNCDWIWLLNNDTVILTNALDQFKAWADHAPSNVGMVGCKIIHYYHREEIQSLGGHFNKWSSRSHHLGEGLHIDTKMDMEAVNRDLDYVIGASMFVKREFIADVGMLSEDYFLYYEELDWAIRAKSKGWKLMLIPELIVYHKEGATITGADRRVKSLLSDVCNIRNKMRFTALYYPNFMIVSYFTIFLIIINRAFKRQYNRIPVILKVIFTKSGFEKFIASYR